MVRRERGGCATNGIGPIDVAPRMGLKTMRGFLRGVTLLVCGAGLGAAAMFGVFRYHVVRADDGWHTVPTGTPVPGNPYADVRHWTADDWAAHPALTAAVVEAGHGDLVVETSAGNLVERLIPRH